MIKKMICIAEQKPRVTIITIIIFSVLRQLLQRIDQ